MQHCPNKIHLLVRIGSVNDATYNEEPIQPHTVTIAAERIERLEELARKAVQSGEDGRARRYVQRARRIAERNRIELPRSFVRYTCDQCDIYRRPGDNTRVRVDDGMVVITCECGEIDRFRYEE